jgi:tetratricopeptide (TPR) repeat protein
MADDEVFQEAVEALRAGNKSKARELLTDLIKTNQNNATYWIWLSAAMDSAKERVYCLQTAFKLDPENATAKRGLILLGALPADESVQPFPLNRPRAWEEKLLLAHEKPKPKGWEAVRQSPVLRLGLAFLLLGGLIAGVVFGLIIPSTLRAQRQPTAIPGTPQTFTPSPTALGAKPQATNPIGTPSGPLSELLAAPYTPTALYVAVERSPLTSDYLLQFNRVYKAGDWDQAIQVLQNIVTAEPDAAYAYYYMGEAYRFKNDPSRAIDAYNQGIQKDSNFGPMYVGLSRARLMADPNANVLPLLDQAINLDPAFGEAYLERGIIKIRDNDITGALKDLSDANTRLPDSPLVFYNLARARFQEGNLDLALAAAQHAQQLDVTMLESYLLLGQIHAEAGDNDEAIKSLQLYLKYKSDDVPASVLFGKLLFDIGEYQQTIQMMDRVISLERTRREAYLYRFLANVELGNGPAADNDLSSVLNFYSNLFEANLGVIRTHFLNERYGSAEQAVGKTESLAETDEQKALIYYWAALVFEKREKPEDAAAYWQLLLDLPEEAMTAEMRTEAEEHLLELVTATPSPTPTHTKKPTPTKKVTVTPTRTPTRTRTPTPTPTK